MSFGQRQVGQQQSPMWCLERNREPLVDGPKTTLCMGCSDYFCIQHSLIIQRALSGTNAKKKASLPNRAIWGQSLPKLVPMQSPTRLVFFSSSAQFLIL